MRKLILSTILAALCFIVTVSSVFAQTGGITVNCPQGDHFTCYTVETSDGNMLVFKKGDGTATFTIPQK